MPPPTSRASAQRAVPSRDVRRKPEIRRPAQHISMNMIRHTERRGSECRLYPERMQESDSEEHSTQLGGGEQGAMLCG
jgi:hypothetical protein